MFLKESVNGPIIYLSATIKYDYNTCCKNIVSVNRRFHNIDLPVPKYVKYFSFNKLIILKKTINSLKEKQILIFVPTIEIGKKLQLKLKYPFVYSSNVNKEKYIQQFKNNKIKVLITTSILERGITFFDVQVIVYEANHSLFDTSTLIQIAGRVGRKRKAEKGKVYFLANSSCESIKKCIKEIILKNKAIV